MLKPGPRILLLLAVSLVAACASGGSERNAGQVTSRNILTRDQIESTRSINAFDAVQKLRSNWMRLRGSTQMPATGAGPQFSENQVLVYLDNQRLGTVDALRQIEIAAVQYIQFFPPAEAAARWGFNHGGGVIYVSTRPGDPQRTQ